MPERKHDFTTTEIKAGAMVLASGLVLFVLVAAVLGLRPPEPTKTFYADFANVKGLRKGADVMFGGMVVGRVTGLSMVKDRHSKIRVAADVSEQTPVNAQSSAAITQTTLTSENHLEISTGRDDAPLVKTGAVLDSAEGGIFDVAGMVADDVRDLMGDVRKLLGVENRPKEELVTIEDLFRNVKTAVDESTTAVKNVRELVEENRDDADSIIRKIQEIEDTAHGLIQDTRDAVAENRPDVKATVANVRAATQRVADATDRLSGMADSLEETLGKLKAIGGDASGFVEKSRPVIEEIILDLREVVWHMKAFARTIEEQPEAVLRGATPQGRKR